ncbi:MAG: hypothetical protein AAF402_11560 [Pseudomonadota bacterium]
MSEHRTDKILKSDRRKTIKALGIGSVVAGASQLPTQWTKPVVQSMVLPSHATTTDSGGDGGAGTTNSPTTSSPTTTPSPCSVACAFSISLRWEKTGSGTGDADLDLEIVTAVNNTRLSPKGPTVGTCLQFNTVDDSSTSGQDTATEQVVSIGGSLAPGDYTVFVRNQTGVAAQYLLDYQICEETNVLTTQTIETVSPRLLLGFNVGSDGSVMFSF